MEDFRDQICARLLILAPQLEDVSYIVDECLANAGKSLKKEFIQRLSPDAWARITLIYYKHFLDIGCDVSIAEIISEVVRDSINTNRMDLITLELSQIKSQQQDQGGKPPSLSIVKNRR